MRRVLAATAYGFVRDLQSLADGVLVDHGMRFAERRADDGILIRPVDPDGRPAPLVLRIANAPVALLNVRYKLVTTNETAGFEIVSSQLILTALSERDPLARLEFDRRLRPMQVAHWHVHAERGAFSEVLTRATAAGQRVRDPARLSTLHYPVGGAHFNPPIEDFLTFLIEECGMDAVPGWRSHIGQARARWKRAELQRVAQDMPLIAAEQLRGMGWHVRCPDPQTSPPSRTSRDHPAERNLKR